MERVKDYSRAKRKFKELVLILCYLTGGQPGRATELLSVQYKNSPNGTGRGIFVEAGLLAIMTAYYKGFGLSSKTKVIHRYLPREVGELVFYYLWLVQPFWEALRIVCGG